MGATARGHSVTLINIQILFMPILSESKIKIS